MQAATFLNEMTLDQRRRHRRCLTMHRTESVDYGIVLEGEIVLVLDGGETVLRAGDVVIQRGTSHARANRSGRMARMAFILVDGAYGRGLGPG